MCDKSENSWVCAKWQWNALDLCYWIALPALPVVQSSNTVSCVSLSFRTHPFVLAMNIKIGRSHDRLIFIVEFPYTWKRSSYWNGPGYQGHVCLTISKNKRRSFRMFSSSQRLPRLRQQNCHPHQSNMRNYGHLKNSHFVNFWWNASD